VALEGSEVFGMDDEESSGRMRRYCRPITTYAAQ